ncbi:hypothetical protein SISNIDRAFT_454208 [Sistotremastrum niveocremeum HHB9708]|uniref:Uncharacterized protein n=1 Tax=Sistotremastrum niveocremeum HHB9708 TaxID=1314777 RepID=A0A164V3E6_9AGAM|nr:hypothetical protein SISNIDRAFT_454208 [Sistotremastrum niveocremeum HHB9708]
MPRSAYRKGNNGSAHPHSPSSNLSSQLNVQLSQDTRLNIRSLPDSSLLSSKPQIKSTVVSVHDSLVLLEHNDADKDLGQDIDLTPCMLSVLTPSHPTSLLEHPPPRPLIITGGDDHPMSRSHAHAPSRPSTNTIRSPPSPPPVASSSNQPKNTDDTHVHTRGIPHTHHTTPPPKPHPSLSFPIRTSDLPDHQHQPLHFTYPFPSPPSPTLPYRRPRPSLEGVFDTPSPAQRTSQRIPESPTDDRTSRPSFASDASTVTPGDHRSSSTTPLLGSKGATTTRSRISRGGENPFTFGGVSPRRVSKGTPKRGGGLPVSELFTPAPTPPSSSLAPPTVSVTEPTPQPSPSKSSTNVAPGGDLLAASSPPGKPTTTPMTSSLRSGAKKPSPPKMVTYQDEVVLDAPSGSGKSKGKRKSEEYWDIEDDPNEFGRKDSTRRNRRISTPPSSFGTVPSRRSSKRIKLSSQTSLPGSQTPSQTRLDSSLGHSSTPPSLSHQSSSHHQPSGPSGPSGTSHTNIASSQDHTLQSPSKSLKRGSMQSQLSIASSIPFSAIMRPVPPSIGRASTHGALRGPEGLWMRDPRKKRHRVGWKPARRDGVDGEKLVGIMSVLFYVAFIFPPIWWCTSLLPSSRIRKPSSEEPSATEKNKDKERHDWEVMRDLQEDFHSWRTRHRIAAVISFVTYIPIIVLLAVFVPR